MRQFFHTCYYSGTRWLLEYYSLIQGHNIFSFVCFIYIHIEASGASPTMVHFVFESLSLIWLDLLAREPQGYCVSDTQHWDCRDISPSMPGAGRPNAGFQVCAANTLASL